MDLHFRQELRVGFLVLVAISFLAGGLIWLSGRSLGGSAFDVRFTSIQGVTVGDPVLISGVRVGRVGNVRLEDVGRVIVTMEVDPSVRPRTDATASVRSLDFLGAKFISYDPGTAETMLEPGQTIEGSEEQGIASGAVGLVDDAQAFLETSSGFFSPEMAEQLRLTMAAVERGLDVVSRLGEGPMVTQATEAITVLNRAVTRLDSTLANPAIDESISQLDEIAEGMREMTEGLALVTTSLGSVLEKIDTSDGTVGLLLNERTLHDDLHDVLQSMRALLDDIRENPGRYGPRSIKLF